MNKNKTARPLTSIFHDIYNVNPFVQPPDDKIFTFKQEETQKRAETREQRKTMKIWEKSRPPRAGRIKELFKVNIDEDDMKFSQTEKLLPNLAINTLVSERNKGKQESRYKLIEKKREMFFLQMMVDLKKTEIQKLEEYAMLRDDGLNYSEKLMEQQQDKFIKYKEKKKEDCLNLAENAENLSKEKALIIGKIKELVELETNVITEKAKSIEKLETYLNYKDFMYKLAGIKEAPLMSTSESLPLFKGRQINDTKANLEEFQRIPKRILHLIERDPNEFQIPFSNLEELHNLFTNLEEQNIFLVQHNHDLEIQLDSKKQQSNIAKEQINKEYEFVKSNHLRIEGQLNEIKESVLKSERTLESNFGFAKENEVHKAISDRVTKLFNLYKAPGDNKTEPLQQLTAIESIVEEKIHKIKDYETLQGGKFQHEVKKIEIAHEKDRRLKKKEQETLKIHLEKLEKDKIRQLKKAKRFKHKQIGRKMMYRSKPLITKIVKEDKKEVNQDELDIQKYFYDD